MGAPHHKPTDELRKFVSSLVMRGLNQEEIAKRLKICKETLLKHYEHEVYDTKIDMDCKIENLAYEKALSGDWKAIEFYLRCKAGWAPAKTLDEYAKEKGYADFDAWMNDRRKNFSEPTIQRSNGQP